MTSTSGDFRALAGTRARIVARALTPAATPAIIVERGTPEAPAAPELVPLVPTADGLEAELLVNGPARYRFQLETVQKHRRVEMGAHTIELEPDAIPTIELYAPADELDVTNMKRIELAYVAEDDFGVTAEVELVWDIAGKVDKKPIATLPDAPGRAQGKLVWDLAEMTLPPGAEVSYHLEVVDNDTIDGPHRGLSRPFKLRVFSPRERHEQNLARQAELAEHLSGELGKRLTVTDGEVPREELHRGLDELTVEAGTLAAAFADEPLANRALRKVVAELRDRLTKLLGAGAARVKAVSMGFFGVGGIAAAADNEAAGDTPHAATMGVIGFLALAANVGVAVLLYRYREGAANMRSVWLCTRNDALGNVAVMAAALGVFGTGSLWPDIAVAAVMAGLALTASVETVRSALHELRTGAPTLRNADEGDLRSVAKPDLRLRP